MSRTQLAGAPYNPRLITDNARRRLRENIKKRGLLGPALIWNRRSGFLVSGHQRLAALDHLEGKGDYLLDVTVVDWDEKEEREQNVFLNAQGAQGEFDAVAFAKMLEETTLDIDAIGFNRVELSMLLEGTNYEAKLEDENVAEAVKSALEQQTALAASLKKQKQEEKTRITKIAWSVGMTAEEEDSCDTEFYAVLVFARRREAERMFSFLAHKGIRSNGRYVDGREFADLIGVEVRDAPAAGPVVTDEPLQPDAEQPSADVAAPPQAEEKP